MRRAKQQKRIAAIHNVISNGIYSPWICLLNEVPHTACLQGAFFSHFDMFRMHCTLFVQGVGRKTQSYNIWVQMLWRRWSSHYCKTKNEVKLQKNAVHPLHIAFHAHILSIIYAVEIVSLLFCTLTTKKMWKKAKK